MLDSAATWSNVVVGTLVVLLGTLTLARKEPLLAWQRRRVGDRWQPYGLGTILFGTMVLGYRLVEPATGVSIWLGLGVLLTSLALGARGLWLMWVAEHPRLTPSGTL